MKRVLTLSLLAAFASTAGIPAHAARNGFETNAISATEFEVIPRARRDIDGYWCAAADFARRTLGAGWQQRIYVLRGYGPSVTTGRKTAVQFSLTPPSGSAQQGSGISAGFVPGDSMKVQSANGRCNVRPVFR